MESLLFVCLGNICRSPLAEGIFRARLADTSWSGRIQVASAGIGDWHIDSPPDARAVAVAARYGIDISGQRARQVVDEDFHRHRLILCADRSNLRRLRARMPPGATACVDLMLAVAGLDAQGEVPDPYFGDEAGFERVFGLLDDAVGRLLTHWPRVSRLTSAEETNG